MNSVMKALVLISLLLLSSHVQAQSIQGERTEVDGVMLSQRSVSIYNQMINEGVDSQWAAKQESVLASIAAKADLLTYEVTCYTRGCVLVGEFAKEALLSAPDPLMKFDLNCQEETFCRLRGTTTNFDDRVRFMSFIAREGYKFDADAIVLE